jgi:transglutaminase-like putative cysteine protease
MVVRIPGLADGREARAIVTYEIQSLQAAVPQDTKRLTAPDPAKLDRKLAVHLAPSPHIESNDPALRKAATETTAAAATAWDKVAAVHAWVHGHIKYEANEGKVQSIAETLQQGNGDCDEMNSLAVAMCRASGIPARLVRIPKHCVYEVYLLDGEGQGHWFCGDASRAGAIAPQAFSGGIIMQKGDNISVTDPKTRRPAKKRFLEETATGLPQTPGARLEMRLINE